MKIIKKLAYIMVVLICSCEQIDYDWENFVYVPTPQVTINLESSALPTYQTAKVSFFNMAEEGFEDSQRFEWELSYFDAEGRARASEIEVYVGFYRSEATPPVYPIVLSFAEVFPTQPQFPLPSIVRNTDTLFERVTSFPKAYSFTPAELAEITGTDLSSIRANDYFLFKFIITGEDGTRVEVFDFKSCDETRGEICDCRVGARFKNVP